MSLATAARLIAVCLCVCVCICTRMYACGDHTDMSNPKTSCSIPLHTLTHTAEHEDRDTNVQTQEHIIMHPCARVHAREDAVLLTEVDKDKSPKRASIGRVYSVGSFCHGWPNNRELCEIAGARAHTHTHTNRRHCRLACHTHMQTLCRMCVQSVGFGF